MGKVMGSETIEHKILFAWSASKKTRHLGRMCIMAVTASEPVSTARLLQAVSLHLVPFALKFCCKLP